MLNLLILIIIILLVLLILCYIKYRNIQNLYEEEKSDWLYASNKFSMLEYQYRKFKEGTNAFTVLRDMGEIIYSGLKDDDDHE